MLKNIIVAMLISTPALAWDDVERSDFASGLGGVIASESICNLKFNQSVIAEMISTTVPPDDLKFIEQMQRYIRVNTQMFEELEGSSKTAHCTAVERYARAKKLIE
jgi:hypothetical protein